jgi:hypothetical protein
MVERMHLRKEVANLVASEDHARTPSGHPEEAERRELRVD